MHFNWSQGFSHSLALASQSKLVCLTGLAWCRPFPADHKAARFYQQSLQDFHPEPGRYDIFWVQWCLM